MRLRTTESHQQIQFEMSGLFISFYIVQSWQDSCIKGQFNLSGTFSLRKKRENYNLIPR